MASEDPEIVLYDLACDKGVCFSPVVWRIRLMLNYKGVPYSTKFLEFQDIEPTLRAAGIPPYKEGKASYSVPAIFMRATGRYIMDSPQIAPALEEAYPAPPLAIDSPEQKEIEASIRRWSRDFFEGALMAKERGILSGKAAEYFVRTREAWTGRSLDSYDAQREEETWAACEQGIKDTAALLRKRGGPFALGDTPSYIDFFIAGFLASARVIDERVFARICALDGAYREIYDACSPWMRRNT